jgi:hypothetical protein
MVIKGKAKENYITAAILPHHILQKRCCKPITRYPKSNNLSHPQTPMIIVATASLSSRGNHVVFTDFKEQGAGLQFKVP